VLEGAGSILDAVVPLLVLLLSALLVVIHVAKSRVLSKAKKQVQLGQQTPAKAGRSKRRHNRGAGGKSRKAHAVKSQTVPRPDGAASHLKHEHEVVDTSDLSSEETPSGAVTPAEMVEADVERAEHVPSLGLPDACSAWAQDVSTVKKAKVDGSGGKQQRKAAALAAAEVPQPGASPAIVAEKLESEATTFESQPAAECAPTSVPMQASDNQEATMEEFARSTPCVAAAASELEVSPESMSNASTAAEDVDLCEEEPLPEVSEKEAEMEQEKEEEEETPSQWGKRSQQLYFRELLLAHRSISIKIARGPPGLTLPEQAQGQRSGTGSLDCIGVEGLRMEPYTKQR